MSNDVDTKSVLKFMFTESFRMKKLYLVLILLPISAISISTGIPLIVSRILAKLAQHPGSFNWHVSIIELVIIGLIGLIANRLGFLILLSTQAKTLYRIQNEMVDNLLSKDGSFYADRMAGKIISDSIGLNGAFIQFQDLIAINMFPFIISLIAGIIVVSTKSLSLGFGLFVMSAVVIVGAIHSSKKRAPLRASRHEALRNLRGHFADIIANSQTVKIFAQEHSERQDHDNLNLILTKKREHEWRLVSTNGNNRIAAILALQAVFVLLTVFRVSNDPALLSTGIFAFTFTISLSNKLFEISSMVQGLENTITDAAPMIEIFNLSEKVKDIDSAPQLQVSQGSIEFKKVDFSYTQDISNNLFNSLSLRIQPGEKVGLVGHSGGGKTSITKLLLRLVDIQDGEILVDGQDIAKVTQKSLRQAISYVPQEPLLFHRTIAENISYALPKSSHEEILNASKKAYAHEFVKDLPNGYETLVGERGIKLSGGQRQRIAIARAILKDAPILVLDEATSALDSESEVLIQKALWKLMEGRTAIVIAHRLSTIQKMDRIIVMDNGKITEQGSHQELLNKKGKYAELWAHQSGGFIEE